MPVREVDDERGLVEALRKAGAKGFNACRPDGCIGAQRIYRIGRANRATRVSAAFVVVVFAIEGRLAELGELPLDAGLNGPEIIAVVDARAGEGRSPLDQVVVLGACADIDEEPRWLVHHAHRAAELVAVLIA